MIGDTLLIIGTIIGFVGLFWRSLDHNAFAPGAMIIGGIVCLVVGGVFPL